MKKEEKEEHLYPNKDTIRIKTIPLKPGQSRLRIQFDIGYKGTEGKTIDGKSMTEPDMTLTVGQLVERHTRGGTLPQREPFYFETEIPTFSDLTDIDEYRTQLAHRLKETEKFIKDEKAQAAAELKKEKADQVTKTESPKNPTKNQPPEPTPKADDNVPD